MALKLASLGAGRLGRAPATLDAARRACSTRGPHPGRAGAGLGRRLGRPRAARAYGRRADRRRRGLRRRRAAAGAPRRSPAPASRRSCSARRKAWRCSTARRSRPPGARRPVRGRARVRRRRWSPARSSTDAARGLRRAVRSAHPRAAPPARPDRGRRGAARADGRQRHPRLAPRRRRARAGPLLPALPAAGDGRRASTCCARPPRRSATEANGVSDNPLVFADDGEVLSGGNFHAEPVAFAADMIALAVCEIGSLAERRIAMLVDPALSGLPAFLTPRARPQLRLHDPAGDRRGAGLGEQAARLSGERRLDPDLGQPGGPRLDGGARRAPAAADGRECRARRRHRAAGRRAGLRLPRAAALERAAGARACASCARGCRTLEDDRHLAPDIEAAAIVAPAWSVSAAGSELLRQDWLDASRAEIGRACRQARSAPRHRPSRRDSGGRRLAIERLYDSPPTRRDQSTPISRTIDVPRPSPAPRSIRQARPGCARHLRGDSIGAADRLAAPHLTTSRSTSRALAAACERVLRLLDPLASSPVRGEADPIFNLGTNGTRASCASPALSRTRSMRRVEHRVRQRPTAASRAAGSPAATAAGDGVHALQMELAMPQLPARAACQDSQPPAACDALPPSSPHVGPDARSPRRACKPPDSRTAA